MSNTVRYSDHIPYEDRKFWYKISHGLGPGTLPEDVHIVDLIESKYAGDYICLDSILNTSELEKYDIKEEAPPEDLLISHYFEQEEFKVDELWVEDGQVNIDIKYGDWKHDHWRCKHLMEKFGYTQEAEVTTESDGTDTYSAHHTYKKL